MTSKEQAAMSDTRRLKVFASKGSARRLTGIGFADTAEGVVDYLGGMWAGETEALANARRLVAAWNACAGIETETLEEGPLIELQDRAGTAEARVDGAETLLRRAVDEWECEFSVGNPTVMAIKDFLDGAKPQPDPKSVL